MSEFYIVVGVAVFFMAWRLDRLGRQLEAVSVGIKAEVAELLGASGRADEMLREWSEDRKQAKKETRQMLIFWGVIGTLYIGWQLLKTH